MAPPLEQGSVAWAKKEVKLKYRLALVWHHVAEPPQPAPALCHQPQEKQQRATQIFNVQTKPGSKACVGYNQATYIDPTPHPKELHDCTHLEQFCHRKLTDLAENRENWSLS